MVRSAVALQPTDTHSRADTPLCPEGTTLEQVKDAVTMCEANIGAGFWQDLWTHGERSPHWSRFAGRICDPMGDPGWSSLCQKDCTLWKGPMLEQFAKKSRLLEGPILEKFMTVSHGWDSTLEQGNRVRRKEW
ncbi:hypothetical protein AV530_007828 [Patagioenas fasciata monilis]|uniref:Uncharacterized protein n=1 Tax=Patagioenas fasciata monilis TaxID=372326 RepID=A0A1V4JSZ0_PATFA|nr:hypothetical protein AV530_007828 [Patagioenas fasciata monilis]